VAESFSAAMKRYIGAGYKAPDAMRAVWHDVKVGRVQRPRRPGRKYRHATAALPGRPLHNAPRVHSGGWGGISSREAGRIVRADPAVRRLPRIGYCVRLSNGLELCHDARGYYLVGGGYASWGRNPIYVEWTSPDQWSGKPIARRALWSRKASKKRQRSAEAFIEGKRRAGETPARWFQAGRNPLTRSETGQALVAARDLARLARRIPSASAPERADPVARAAHRGWWYGQADAWAEAVRRFGAPRTGGKRVMRARRIHYGPRAALRYNPELTGEQHTVLNTWARVGPTHWLRKVKSGWITELPEIVGNFPVVFKTKREATERVNTLVLKRAHEWRGIEPNEPRRPHGARARRTRHRPNPATAAGYFDLGDRAGWESAIRASGGLRVSKADRGDFGELPGYLKGYKRGVAPDELAQQIADERGLRVRDVERAMIRAFHRPRQRDRRASLEDYERLEREAIQAEGAPRYRGGGGEARPRVRVGGDTFLLRARSPFKGRVSRVNPYTADSEPVQRFLRAWHEHGRPHFTRMHPALDYDSPPYRKYAKERRRFIALDTGDSGRFLLDKVSGEIYSIKAYGVPNRRLGTIDELIADYEGGARDMYGRRVNPWSMTAGGTGAHHGHGYTHTTSEAGDYHVWPPSTRRGGYSLKWANIRGLAAPHTGLWHDLGTFRSPNAAKGAAKRHAAERGIKLNPTIRASEIRPGDIILPPAREISLWMRRTLQQEGLPESALELTVESVREGAPDKRGPWLIVRTQQSPQWLRGRAPYPFTFKVRPTSPWPLVRRPGAAANPPRFQVGQPAAIADPVRIASRFWSAQHQGIVGAGGMILPRMILERPGTVATVTAGQRGIKRVLLDWGLDDQNRSLGIWLDSDQLVRANPLPPRTADTMSDAIALSSPSGRMSKRARAAASRRIAVALFGPGGGTRADIMGTTPQPSAREQLLQHAARLRDLAARGMSVRRFTREAAAAEARARALNPRGNPPSARLTRFYDAITEIRGVKGRRFGFRRGTRFKHPFTTRPGAWGVDRGGVARLHRGDVVMRGPRPIYAQLGA
jgi:hypothetical protein